MKHLQWFPGHMTAAMRMMEENLKAVDGVMIVLDSRAPRASLNNKLNKLFENKFRLISQLSAGLAPPSS